MGIWSSGIILVLGAGPLQFLELRLFKSRQMILLCCVPMQYQTQNNIARKIYFENLLLFFFFIEF